MVLTLQLALVVFFLPSTSANTVLALIVVIATCAGGLFAQSTSAFTNAYCNLHCVVVVVVVVFLCDGGCVYAMVVAVQGGFAAVTQPRIHLEERSL